MTRARKILQVKENYDCAANIGAFLMDKTGSVYGHWAGKLSAQEQKDLFGLNLFGGKTIHIDGQSEKIWGAWKVSFGSDSSWTTQYKWQDVPEKVIQDKASGNFDDHIGPS